jgi:O-antigen/teichoic acid export membrane protein
MRERAAAMAPSARGAERYRRATLTFLTALAVKGVALLTLFFSVKLGLSYLGSERFGLWVTALSAAALLSFATLGLDKGLLNALAAADGSRNRAAARRLVSTTFFLFLAIVAALLLLLAPAYPLVPWARLLNAGAGAAEAAPMMAVLIVCTLLALLGSLVDTVQSAYQEGFINGAWEAVGKLLGLGALAAAIAFGAGLPTLALAFAGAPLLAALGNALLLFGRRRPWLAPRLRLVQRSVARRLLGAGTLFFLSQLALSVAYYVDNLIVASLAGSEAVAAYAVTARLFDFPGMLLLLIGGALWPPLAEALAQGDISWAERGLGRLILASLALAGTTALPLILLGPQVIRWWVGGAIAPPGSLFAAFGIFWMLSALTQPIGVFLSAANALRLQLACVTLLAAGGLVLKLLLAQRFGMEGVAWGRVVAEALFLLLPYLVFLPRVVRGLRGRAAMLSVRPSTLRQAQDSG